MSADNSGDEREGAVRCANRGLVSPHEARTQWWLFQCSSSVERSALRSQVWAAEAVAAAATGGGSCARQPHTFGTPSQLPEHCAAQLCIHPPLWQHVSQPLLLAPARPYQLNHAAGTRTVCCPSPTSAAS